MLACTIHAKEDLRIETATTPVVGPGEVLVRLGAGGICGSDLHYYFEGRNGSFVIREPLIPGHEASGVVAAVGAGVTRVKEGDKIAVSPSHACGRCDYCRQGREQLCTSMKFLGSASLFPHVQGMFQEYFVMGERQCYPVTGDVSLGELAFAEPLAVALHAVNRAGDLLGKSVVDHRGRHDRMPHRDGCAPCRRGAGHRQRRPRPAARKGARGRCRSHDPRRPRRRRARRAAVRRGVRGVGQLRGAQVLRRGRKEGRAHRASRHPAARTAAVRRQRADGEGARPLRGVPLGHRVRLGGRTTCRRAASTCGRF